VRQLLRTDLASLALPAGVWVQCNFLDGVAVAEMPRRDSSSRSNSSMRSFRLAACRSCAGVNCNRFIAAQLRKPYGNATQYFPTRPLVRKPDPRLLSPPPIPSACRRTLHRSSVCEYDPAPWATLILMACRAATGTVTRPKRARSLTTRTGFGTLVPPGGGRLLQRGSPPPPPLTDPAGHSLRNEWLHSLSIHRARTLLAHEGRWARI
jgi:hypothetical protein